MMIAVCRTCVSAQAKPVLKNRLVAVVALIAGAMMPLSAQAQSANPLGQTYHERTFILEANRKCSLFGGKVVTALGAAALQTRGALLRAGHDSRDVGTLASRAAGQARNTDCSDAALRQSAQRIVNAFTRWERAARLEFPAHTQGWSVDRFAGSNPGWRMVQNGMAGKAPARFGMAGLSPENAKPTVVIAFKGQARPYAARLVMRDDGLLPNAYAIEAGYARMPPLSSRRMIFASRQSTAPQSLLPEGSRQGEAWEFPDEAMTRLGRLDPREPFWIEFLFRDDSIARVPFEAGDAAAATAFLGLGSI